MKAAGKMITVSAYLTYHAALIILHESEPAAYVVGCSGTGKD
jgi:hypothetical protein